MEKKAPEKSLSFLVQGYLEAYFHSHNQDLSLRNLHETIVKEVEKPLIMLILEKTRYNQSKTAFILGINRNTLNKKIKDLGIPLKDAKFKIL
jgi:two-component system nitrogen regulation response regulator GlnG